jgi:hypothetical protein
MGLFFYTLHHNNTPTKRAYSSVRLERSTHNRVVWRSNRHRPNHSSHILPVFNPNAVCNITMVSARYPVRVLAPSLIILTVIFISGCLCCNLPGLGQPAEEHCTTPDIQVGTGCCLDSNGNGMCDTDEASPQEESTTSSTLEETTTTFEAATTTTATTSTTSSSTSSSSTLALPTTTSTTMPKIACTVNGDCGQSVQERVCYQGNVYLRRTSPVCQNPGKTNARCIVKVVQDTNPTETCSGSDRHCIDGECVFI